MLDDVERGRISPQAGGRRARMQALSPRQKRCAAPPPVAAGTLCSHEQLLRLWQGVALGQVQMGAVVGPLGDAGREEDRRALLARAAAARFGGGGGGREDDAERLR